MKFLITGAKGQLAKEFLRALQRAKGEVLITLDKQSLDVSDSHAVSEAVSNYKPDVVINCAAYNLVDKAEEDFDTTFRVNAIGPKNLASACKQHHSLLVHYSTDYVFDGQKEDFYTEQDEPAPINNYGKSKLSGEEFLKEETDDYLLFRVSWVYGDGKQNFLLKLKEWAEKNRVIRVVCDQVSIPTYTEDIVRFTLQAVNQGLRGIYHLTNGGYTSRYEVARYFCERIGLDRIILPVGSDYFNQSALSAQGSRRSAKRPYFSAMSNAKLSKDLRITIPDWKDGIDRFVKRSEEQ